MTLYLSRVIPMHRRTVKFRWVKTDFMVMSERYRAVRARFSNQMDKCDWCQRAFVDGEMMALAQPEKGHNWVLCQTCRAAMEVTP